MKGKLLIGGGFFTHEQLDFIRLLASNPFYCIHTIAWEELTGEKKIPIEEDFVVILGMKGLVRMLTKKGTSPRKIMPICKTFFQTNIPPTLPLFVVDDFSTNASQTYQKKIIPFFQQEFNLRAYLLREYLKTSKYPKWVIPFSLPCNSNLHLAQKNGDKTLDIFFQGNASSSERIKISKKIQKRFSERRLHLKITHSGVKNVAERLTRDAFLHKLSDSKLSLSFTGSGYDCYRYHEIASVGSIVVSPDYPLFIRNDYRDMKECVKYKNFRDLHKKVQYLFENPSAMDEMQTQSIYAFKNWHTCEVRAKEFEDILTASLMPNRTSPPIAYELTDD
jgi:hypothetical protein